MKSRHTHTHTQFSVMVEVTLTLKMDTHQGTSRRDPRRPAAFSCGGLCSCCCCSANSRRSSSRLPSFSHISNSVAFKNARSLFKYKMKSNEFKNKVSLEALTALPLLSSETSYERLTLLRVSWGGVVMLVRVRLREKGSTTTFLWLLTVLCSLPWG